MIFHNLKVFKSGQHMNKKMCGNNHYKITYGSPAIFQTLVYRI